MDPQSLRHLVKRPVSKTASSVNLAGRITLDRFRQLLSKVDLWFPLYYPLTAAGAPGVPSAPEAPATGAGSRPRRRWRPPSRPGEGCGKTGCGPGLGKRAGTCCRTGPHRKLNQDRLWEFLSRTQGGWFRLLDFTRHFGVDRKTSWEYLQKFLHAGLLRHNRGRSAAVRYALETRFLVVLADALEPEIEAALDGLPPSLVAQVSGWLIATGGEAFWEKELARPPGPLRCRQLLTRLKSAGTPYRGGPGGGEPDAADRAPLAPE